MNGTPEPTPPSVEPVPYQIRVQGHLDVRWAARLGGLTLSHEPDGTTTLSGLKLDQAALHGVLKSVRDLGVPLLSVIPVALAAAQAPEVDGQPERPLSES